MKASQANKDINNIQDMMVNAVKYRILKMMIKNNKIKIDKNTRVTINKIIETIDEDSDKEILNLYK